MLGARNMLGKKSLEETKSLKPPHIVDTPMFLPQNLPTLLMIDNCIPILLVESMKRQDKYGKIPSLNAKVNNLSHDLNL
ncbi:hypothetical protein H5410_048725 [Solanum commersonii]|uniref:Uncharacterized protein n=1 Tax=Solanum commersonii TaxID=4109 RepID=A0A9J5XJ08_SOLCO|nr:hypothetical protein H5410_048725 [Solanum commersonii]